MDSTDMAEGGQELEEIVVTPSKDKTFGDLYHELEAMKLNQKEGIQPKLATMMIDLLKASGHLEDTSSNETKPAVKKKVALPTLNQLPPAPKMMLQHPPKPSTGTSMSQPPRLTWFSGENAKGELTYDLWRYNVRCLLKQKLYSEDMIHQAIRSSLRGEAGRIVMRLGTDVSAVNILNKLDSIYGNIDKRESLMAEFYGARQQEDEDITTWSCRLESIIGKAQDLGLVEAGQVDSMLHSMLWTGLRQDLKDISSHKYDTIPDFDSLRVCLRQIEKDHTSQKYSAPHKTKQGTSKSAVVTQNPEYEELKGMINQLTQKVTSLEQNTTHQQTQYNNRGGYRGYDRGNRRGFSHPPSNSWQPRPTQQGLSSQHYQQQPPTQQNYRQPPTAQQSYQQPPSTQQQYYQDYRQEPQCSRCGQFGHLQFGCRVILDHRRRPLNSRKPMTRDQY